MILYFRSVWRDCWRIDVDIFRGKREERGKEEGINGEKRDEEGRMNTRSGLIMSLDMHVRAGAHGMRVGY